MFIIFGTRGIKRSFGQIELFDQELFNTLSFSFLFNGVDDFH